MKRKVQTPLTPKKTPKKNKIKHPKKKVEVTTRATKQTKKTLYGPKQSEKTRERVVQKGKGTFGSHDRARGSKKVALKKEVKNTIMDIVHGVVDKKAPVSHYRKVIGFDCDIYSDSLAAAKSQRYKIYAWTVQGLQGTIGTPSAFSGRLSPMNTKRILDAASVLYNGKDRSTTIETGTKNFDVKELKVYIPYYSWKALIKNHTNEAYMVKIHKFTARANTDVAPETYFQNGIDDINWVGGAPGVPVVVDNGSYQRYPYGIHYGVVESFKNYYKHEIVEEKLMYPGHEISIEEYYRDVVVDFGDFINGSSPTAVALASFGKGTNLYHVEVIPQLEGASRDFPSSTGSVFHSRLVPGSASNSDGWLCLVDEHWAIEQPDKTLDANVGQKRALLEVVGPVDASTGTTQFYTKRSGPVTTVLQNGTA